MGHHQQRATRNNRPTMTKKPPAKPRAAIPTSRTFVRPACDVRRHNNVVSVGGRVLEGDYKKILAAMHQTIADAGFDDLILDFSSCHAASPGCMLPICASATQLRNKHHSTELKLPSADKMRRLFVNANWAHLISPRDYDPALKVIGGQVPATQFQTAHDQQDTVNKLIETLLGNVSGLTRKQFQAIEWTLNEITDNVLNHAESSVGGFVQLSMLERTNRLIELVVADAGIGIPNSLRTTRPHLDDLEAVEMAIREGVTRDKRVGQGNGLFGTFQICEKSKGQLRIDSGRGTLSFSGQSGFHMRNEAVPFEGTVIDVQVGLGEESVLGLALVFGTKEHQPADHIELKYETDDLKYVEFVLCEQRTSFGSRIAARPIRTKLSNLIKMCPGERIRVDFRDIRIVSSSFADEVFGRLFVELGPLTFMQRMEFVAIDDTVRMLVDRAISQRAVTDLGNRLTGDASRSDDF